MIQLVVSDLDGTLLNENHQVSEFTCQTIRQLAKKGIQFMIATGRHYQDVYLTAQKIDVDMFLITSNGARVHDKKGNLVYEDNIPEELVADVFSLSESFEVHRNVYLEDVWLVEEPNERLLAMHNDTQFFYKLTDFKTINSKGIVKIYFNAKHAELVKLEQQLSEHFNDRLNITFTTDEYLEVMNAGVSKGHALEQVLKIKDIAAKDTMAFGDGLNDKEMLELVGHPVVMENANPKLIELLPQKNHTGTNFNDGVAKYIINQKLM